MSMIDVQAVTEMTVTVRIKGELSTIAWPALAAAADQDAEDLSAVYRTIRDAARAKLRQLRISALVASVQSCPKHRATRTDTRAFVGPVVPSWADENRAAHGNITDTHHCRCGAVQRENINGCHVETGAWHAPIADVSDRETI